jgi:cytosine/adenosine deaminase-related metal-dependent hydrolase
MPFMTHLAESDEEFDMFENASGPLHGFLSGLGRRMFDTGGRSPVARLLDDDALPDGAILAHMNWLAESDWDRLAGHRFSIVHCPGCHEYFRRPPFPASRFREAGFNICLGTDSLASNRKLSMFGEMQELRLRHPDIPEPEILDMATRNAAAAIGLPGLLGEVREGAHADLIAIPFTGSPRDAITAVVSHQDRVAWSMVAGTPVNLLHCPSDQASA